MWSAETELSAVFRQGIRSAVCGVVWCGKIIFRCVHSKLRASTAVLQVPGYESFECGNLELLHFAVHAYTLWWDGILAGKPPNATHLGNPIAQRASNRRRHRSK